MFDVHILSINVDIHYISVLIKYFSRGKSAFECVCIKEGDSVEMLKCTRSTFMSQGTLI